jgi:hypothetical protein
VKGWCVWIDKVCWGGGVWMCEMAQKSARPRMGVMEVWEGVVRRWESVSVKEGIEEKTGGQAVARSPVGKQSRCCES